MLVSELDVDAHWPERNLVVELDSWEFHVAAGHRVMRLTWRQLKGRETWDRLSAALRRP